MSTSESDCIFVDDDEDEEGKLYQLIYEMRSTEDGSQSKDDAQIPILSELEPEHTTEDERRTQEAETACLVFTGKKTTHPTTIKTTEQGQTEQKVSKKKKNLGKRRAENICRKRSLKRIEEKPWLKPGADISDYFNFGFDEESWKSYCLKQMELQAAHRELYNNIMGQEGHTLHEDKKSASSSSAPRQSRSTKAATRGRRGGKRGKQQRCVCDRRNNTKGANKTSHDEAGTASCHLCSLSDGSLFRPEPAKDRSPSKHHDDPSASVKPSSSGVTALIPKTAAYSAAVINTSKAWEHVIPQELCGEDGSRDVWPRQDRRRGRERRKENTSSEHSSHKEPQGHGDMTKQSHKHHRNKGERGNREKRRHRDKMEEQEQSSHSSRRAEMDINKDEDVGRSHKRNKSKRKRNKENKEMRADRGRKLKSD